jgi:hypothetical protein
MHQHWESANPPHRQMKIEEEEKTYDSMFDAVQV